METEPQIVFEGLDSSDAVRARVLEEIGKLEQYHGRITSCRVVIEAPDRHKHKGGRFKTRIFMSVPGGGEIVVDRNHPKDQAHEDVYVSIRDAFNAARRQLKSYAHKKRGDVKTPEGPPVGVIKYLNGFEEFGTIESPDGYEIYFHKNSVIDGGFDALKIGDLVRFHEEQGEKGPQASTVHPVGKS